MSDAKSEAEALLKSVNKPSDYSPGLEGVVAARSRLCLIDGAQGKLYYCGYPIEELVMHSTYEEVCFLLWYGKLPRHDEFEKFQKHFRDHRALPPEVLAFIELLPHTAHPMDALRTIVSLLASFDHNPERSPESNLHRSIQLTAQLPTIVATFHRLRQNQKPIAPSANLSHASNFLYMLFGKEPEEMTAKVMDAAKKKLPDVKFDTAWTEKKGDSVNYEVRGKDKDGKTRDVKVSPSGDILEVD